MVSHHFCRDIRVGKLLIKSGPYFHEGFGLGVKN